jgi:hypothetical protein
MRDRFKDITNIDVNLAPMLDYYNSIADYEFVKVLEYFSNGFGYGDEYYLCEFPNSWEPWEKEYFENGVRFTVGSGYNKENSSIVDYSTFYKFSRLACEDYLKEHPEDKEKIYEILSAIKVRYEIKE